MARLIIKSLQCVKKQTTVGPDKVSIYIDGEKHSGPYTIHRTEVLPLNADGGVFKHPTKQITLWEEDSGPFSNDDNLGTVPVSNTVGEDLSALFHHLPGADYHMKYSVVTE